MPLKFLNPLLRMLETNARPIMLHCCRPEQLDGLDLLTCAQEILDLLE